jgi:hypothetical protein
VGCGAGEEAQHGALAIRITTAVGLGAPEVKVHRGEKGLRRARAVRLVPAHPEREGMHKQQREAASTRHKLLKTCSKMKKNAIFA